MLTTVNSSPKPAVGPSTTRSGSVPLLVATALVVLIQLYVSIPLQQPVAVDLGASGVTAALAAGYSLFYALGFLVFGPLSDHVGRRRVLVYGMNVLTAVTVAVGLAPSMAALASLRAVQGVAAATFAPAALAFLGEALPPRKRASAIGAISVAFLTAGIIGQLSATAIATSLGWRWTFYLSGIVLAVFTAVATMVIREPDVKRPHQALPLRYVSLLRFAVRPRSMLLALAHLVVLSGFVGMYTLLGPHLETAGLTAGLVTLIRAAALPAMFCSLLAGPLIARIGAPRTALVGFSLATAGIAAEAVLDGAVPAIVAASVVFVAGIAILVPTMITLWGEAAHPARGIGMAINGFVLFLGASLGAYATELPGGFTGALALIAPLYLTAGVIVLAATRARPERS